MIIEKLFCKNSFINIKGIKFIIFIFFIFLIFFFNEIQLFKKNSATKMANNISFRRCYYSSDNSNIRIIHLIFTRFIMEFWNKKHFRHVIYKKRFILNGIRVMKKYLLPSLENQSCRNFIWILTIGKKVSKTYIKSLLNFDYSFQYEILFSDNIKYYVRNISKGFDVLITTLIDYDDRIYYDAVNDVRKAININRPLIIHGYTRGVYYFEQNNKYYELFGNFNNSGPMSVFHSLITVLNKVNDSYTIFDLHGHSICRKILLKKYKSFGIKNLNYEPAIFDSGDIKFVWVRQKFSALYNNSIRKQKTLKLFNFNLSNFYGK